MELGWARLHGSGMGLIALDQEFSRKRGSPGLGAEVNRGQQGRRNRENAGGLCEEMHAVQLPGNSPVPPLFRTHCETGKTAWWATAPLVVLTSIRRSRPDGSKDKMSYPAPSPSSAAIQRTLQARSDRCSLASCRSLHFERRRGLRLCPSARLRLSRSTGSNFRRSCSSCRGRGCSASNVGGSTNGGSSSGARIVGVGDRVKNSGWAVR